MDLGMLLSVSAAEAQEATNTVAVVGLGKIGLPLAAQFAAKGWHVIGCDVDPAVVDAVNRGASHINEEAGLEEAVATAHKAGLLRAVVDAAEAVRDARTVVVIVPLMVDGEGRTDFRNLDAATAAITSGLQRGTLVIYETTLPVGTTRGRIAPMVEEGSGLKRGSDFLLAFSPERIYAGRIFEDLRKYPKIVGGIDAASTERAVQFYKSVLDAEVWPVENAETAEFTKLAETTYRDVNIALANQLAMFGAARDVNVTQAFKAANSQPFSHLHKASIGVGGHCIPVYPRFLLNDAKDGEMELVRLSRMINDGMAAVSVDRLERVLGGLEDKRVLVLGASYREDVKEMAFSTAIPVVELLHRRGAHVLINDPLYEPGELASFEAEFVDLDRDLNVDAVVIQAFHHQYRSLDWTRFHGLKVVLDGRGALDPAAVTKTGARYLAVGLPD